MGERLGSMQVAEPKPGLLEDAKQKPQHHVTRPQSRVAAALVALGFFGAGSYLVWIAFTPTGSPDRAFLAPGEVHRIRLDGPPQPTAAGEGAAWTAVGTSENDDLLWRIDAATERPQVLPNTRGAGWPAVGEGFAWVTCTGKDNPCRGPSVLKLDPDSGETLETITLPEYPFQISTGLGAVWVAMSEGLAKLDPVEGQVTAVFQGRYNHVGTAGGSVWATSYDPDRVYRIDPTSGTVLETLVLGSPCRFEASNDVVWLATCVGEVGDKETLTKIDAKTAEVVFQAPLASYGQMRGVGETLWFASHAEDRSDVIEVVRLDPQSGKVAGEPMRISTGDLRFMSYGPGSPGVFVAADDRSLWLTDFGAGEVIRLGLPSVAPLASPVPPSIPSEARFSPGVATTPGNAEQEGKLGTPGNVTLPEKFPSSFPFPDRTTTCGASTWVEEGRRFFRTCFRVSAPYDDVVAFYQRALPERGWSLEPFPHGAERGRIAAFEVVGEGFSGELEIGEEPGLTTLYVDLDQGGRGS